MRFRVRESAAARAPLARPVTPCFERQEIRFSESTYTVLSVCAVAEVAGYDASGQTLHVQALCENQERPALAAGDCYLYTE